MAILNDDYSHIFFTLQQTFDNLTNDNIFDDLSNESVSVKDFTAKYGMNSDLSFLHLNIRTLNSKLVQFKELINHFKSEFDVIVLSEIWANNLTFFHNILPGYEFIYNSLSDTIVGGS